jgi:hypothetical protein
MNDLYNKGYMLFENYFSSEEINQITADSKLFCL